jgi:hypothetical protein
VTTCECGGDIGDAGLAGDAAGDVSASSADVGEVGADDAGAEGGGGGSRAAGIWMMSWNASLGSALGADAAVGATVLQNGNTSSTKMTCRDI